MDAQAPVITISPAVRPAVSSGWMSRMPPGSADTSGLHAMWVNADGELYAIGRNLEGQLGDGTNVNRPGPVKIAIGVDQVSVGSNRSFFLKADGSLWGAGENGWGHLGDGTTENRWTPVQVASGVASVSAGSDGALFLKHDGTLWGFGRNTEGELGDGTKAERLLPVQVAADVVSVSAGGFHTLFVKSDGTLWAVGDNGHGQLGDGTTVDRTLPVQIATDVVSVAAGGQLSLFIKSDGTLWGMGKNEYGELGDGTTTQRLLPVKIADGVANASAGWAFGHFIKANGTLWGMGMNLLGQLGDGTLTNRPTAVQISSDVVTSAGRSHSGCFVGDDGTLWVTGINPLWGLLQNSPEVWKTPEQFSTGLSMLVKFRFMPGLSSSFTVAATGSEPLAFEWRKDGVAIPGATSPSLAFVDAQSDATGRYTIVVTNSEGSAQASFELEAILPPVITAQPQSAEILDSDTFVLSVGVEGTDPLNYLWRKNGVDIPDVNSASLVILDAQNDDSGDYSVVVSNPAGTAVSDVATILVNYRPRIWQSPARHPVLTQGGAVFSAAGTVSAGAATSMFLKAGGELWGMGGNSRGELGVQFVGIVSPPVRIGEGYAAMSTGLNHTLFLKADGSLWTSGYNAHGQLGDGTTSHRVFPVQIDHTVAVVAAGARHSLFVKSDGSLWAMGLNQHGELGDGFTTQRNFPVQVASGVVSVAAGLDNSLFLKSDGTLWGMGSNNHGMLGDGTNVERHSPVQIATGVISMAMGGDFSLFITADGSLWGMGANGDGQLGDDLTGDRFTPFKIAENVLSVAAGEAHTLFINANGRLWGMGRNSDGQLGDGTWQNRSVPEEIASDVAFAAAGAGHSLFVKTDGSLWMIGANYSGQCGVGLATTSIRDPLKLTDGLGTSPRISLAPGTTLTFTAPTTGTGPLTFQWQKDGVDIVGAIGPSLTITDADASTVGVYTVTVSSPFGTGESSFDLFVNIPPAIVTHPLAQEVPLGEPVTFAVTAEGPGQFAYQWSRDGMAIPGATAATFTIPRVRTIDAGDYTVTVWSPAGSATSVGAILVIEMPPALVESPAYRPVMTGGQAVYSPAGAIGAGGWHGIFLKADGSMWVVGDNEYGQLGIETGSEFHAPVRAGSGVVRVAAGPVETYFVRADASLWGSGLNAWGSLGDGTTLRRTVPVKIADDVTAMAAGVLHNLFLKSDGTLWGMGSNANGELGDGTRIQRLIPVQAATDVVGIAAGGSTSLFVKSDGTLWGMGKNTGWGSVDPVNGRSSVPVELDTGVATMAAAGAHLLYVKTDGTLWGLGDNQYGQLGMGSGGPYHSPVQIDDRVVSVAATGDVSFYVKEDGTLWGMGANPFGVLGDGTTNNHLTPIKVATDVVSVSMGAYHVYFVKENGTLWAAGSNVRGRLGDDTTVDRSPAVQVAAGLAVRPRLETGPGSSVTFTARATGTGPLSFQWRKDGSEIGGATSAELTVSDAQAEDAGTYEVIVTNALGAATSSFDLGLKRPLTAEIQSGSQAVTPGQIVVFGLNGGGEGATYQWRRNGVDIAGATGSRYTIYDVQLSHAGIYSAVVIKEGMSIESVGTALTVTGPQPARIPRLINLSTRAFAGNGGSTFVVGLYIGGTGVKTVLIRGIGPKLLDHDVPDVVADPALRVFSGASGLIAQNDDWDHPLAAEFAAVGAFALDPGSKDAALKVTLQPGSYTIHLVNPGPVAEALIEVYDLSRDSGTRMKNLSCRADIPDGKPVIVGTVVDGGSMSLVTRGVGVGLIEYMQEHERPFVLLDPALQVFSANLVIAENDDWDPALESHFAEVGAFALLPGSEDAAHRVAVSPGGYTVHTTGKGIGGIVLVELYESP